MINMHPFRVTVLYRSGARDTFTTGSFIASTLGNDLTGVEWKGSRPQRLFTRLADVVSISSERRFPWGIFA